MAHSSHGNQDPPHSMGSIGFNELILVGAITGHLVNGPSLLCSLWALMWEAAYLKHNGTYLQRNTGCSIRRMLFLILLNATKAPFDHPSHKSSAIYNLLNATHTAE